MKYSTLSEKRQKAVRNEISLAVDDQDNIVFIDGDIVLNAMLYNFFEYSNI